MNTNINYAINELRNFEEINENYTGICMLKDCVLVQKATPKMYTYMIYNYMTGEKALVARRKNTISNDDLESLMEKVKDKQYDFYDKTHPVAGVKLIEYIFKDVFASYGFSVRKKQVALSVSMYKNMINKGIELSDVAVGFGKTHAYLVAGIVYRRLHSQVQPVVISTSSKKLQSAIVNEYLPEISKMLLEHGIIEKPLNAVIRKGMDNYLCQYRLSYYLKTLDENKKNKDELYALRALEDKRLTELDGLDIREYDKKRISVISALCEKCKSRNICSYKKMMLKSYSNSYDFQVCNHNYYLADAKSGKNKFIPKHSAVIFDEAHKLEDAASSIYGDEICKNTILKLLNRLKPSEKATTKNIDHIDNINKAVKIVNNLFDGLEQKDIRNQEYAVSLSQNNLNDIETLHKLLKNILARVSKDRIVLVLMLYKLIRAFENIRGPNVICWIEATSKLILKYSFSDIGKILSKDIFEKNISYSMTSGTISINGDFKHFKRQVGLKGMSKEITEVHIESDFDYYNNSLIYKPDDKIIPLPHDENYTEYMSGKILNLIDASNGHAMVLFTSYKQMNKVYHSLKGRINHPIFKASRNASLAIKNFRQSENGVLFGCGSLWEGVDFKGDLLSHLIIVKLPFLIPDPITEHKRKALGEARFKIEVLIPQMLIKLRQGHGRAIRCESDTAVISILDARAFTRYKDSVISSLPNTPVVNDMEKIKQFILEKKDKSYLEKAVA